MNGICCISLHNWLSILTCLQFDNIYCSESVHMVLTEDSPVSDVVKGTQDDITPRQKRIIRMEGRG